MMKKFKDGSAKFFPYLKHLLYHRQIEALEIPSFVLRKSRSDSLITILSMVLTIVNFILSFIDYEQAFDSVDRRALAKVLSLYGTSGKYIKVICVMYENNTAAIKAGIEVSNWFLY